MKITRISAYQVDLPMREGAYSWAGHSFAAFDSTVVKVETDAGIEGFGEVCPLGPAYLAAYAEGARAAIAKLAPGLIGEDPRHIERVYHRMERLLKGHGYAKSALDMACWDILGKASGLPLYALLGGKFSGRIKLFKVICKDEPEVMAAKVAEYRAAGYDHFQMKVGGRAAVDIARIRQVAAELRAGETLTADANTGWLLHDAMRVARGVRDVDLYLEQPCLSYDECLSLRRHTDHPLVLDECMDSIPMIMRGHRDRAMDVVNLKIMRMGGISRLRQARDLCTQLGITMAIEDAWGGEIVTAAIAHLSQSAPPGFHFQSSAFTDYNTVHTADSGVVISGGFMSAGDAPGLGITPRMEVLGNAVFETAPAAHSKTS